MRWITSYYQFVLALQFSQAVTLLSAIFLRLNTKKTALFYLGLFIINIFFITVLCFIYLELGASAILKFRGFQTLSLLSLGPCLYFYLKFSMIPNYSYQKRDFLNILPFIIGFVICLPFAMQSNEARFYDFYGPLDFKAITLVRLFSNVTLFYYFVVCLHFIKKHESALIQVFSNSIGYKMRWAYLLLGSLGVLASLSLVMTLVGVNQVVVTFAMEVCVISFFVIGIYSHMHSPFLSMSKGEMELIRAKHFELNSDNKSTSVPQTETELKNKKNAEKYKTSPLSREQLKTHLKKLEQLIENEPELFLESGLHLSELARRMNLPPYLASQVINEGMEKSFYDLVNEQRIKKAKEILGSFERSNQSILDIGYEVGYSSKSTFNSSFKKYTGMTPSQFKKFNLDK